MKALIYDGPRRVKFNDWVCISFNVACGSCKNCERKLTGACLVANPCAAAEEKTNDYVRLSDIVPTGWHATQLAGLRRGESGDRRRLFNRARG